MTTKLRQVRRVLAGLATESRPEFQRVDVSPARYDAGAWLASRH